MTRLYQECLAIIHQAMHRPSHSSYWDRVVLTKERFKLFQCHLDGSCSFRIQQRPDESVTLKFDLTVEGARAIGIILGHNLYTTDFKIKLPSGRNHRVQARNKGVNCVRIQVNGTSVGNFQELFRVLLDNAMQYPGPNTTFPRVVLPGADLLV